MALTDMMLGMETGLQGDYMCTVFTSAILVYVYIVTFGWLVVPEVWIIMLLLVIDSHNEIVVL